MAGEWPCPICGYLNDATAVVCAREPDHAAPAGRRAAASIAANISWARTPNRTERTAPARAGSPVSYEYWLKRITDEGVVREKDRAKAAASAHKAYMQQMSRKAAAARKKNARSRRATRAA